MVKYGQVLTLYKEGISSLARAAMMICDQLEVDVKIVEVVSNKIPTLTLPALETGNSTITDSHAILMYLADVNGKDNNIYPKDEKQRALVKEKLIFKSNILMPRVYNMTMVLTLYKLNPSPPARATMMICDLLKLDVKMVDVNLITGEHLTPDFLKKNPTHTIPVLEDGDLTITDSHAILMYLADVYGKDNTLYPKDVKQRALVNQKLFFNSTILFPRLRNITYPMIIEGLTEIPEKLLKAIDEAYGYLEEFLTRSKYIAANHITIADIAAYATTSSLTQLLKLDPKKYPKVEAWHAVIEQNPFVQRQNTAGMKQLKELIDAKLASKK